MNIVQIAGKRAQIQQFAPLVEKEILTLSKGGIRKGKGEKSGPGFEDSPGDRIPHLLPCSI